MMTYILKAALYLIFIRLNGLYCAKDAWQSYDVYTGRHFNDLVTSPRPGLQDRVATPTFLLLYSPQCADDMQKFLQTGGSSLPGPHALILAKHDYETFPKHVWFDFDDRDNLKARYMMESDPCFKVLYWPAGVKLSSLEVVPPNLDLASFVWYKFFSAKDIVNELQIPIIAQVAFDKDNAVLNGTVAPGSREKLYMFMSLTIIILTEDNHFIYGEMISTNSTVTEIIITEEKIERFKKYEQKDGRGVDLETWNGIITYTKKGLDRYESHWRKALRTMYLCAIKFPSHITRLSNSGYTIEAASSDTFFPLKEYIDGLSGENMTKEQGHDSGEPARNTRVALTSKIRMTGPKRRIMLRTLLPSVEHFTGQYMDMATAVVRLYDLDTVVRDHVDTKEDHVITVLYVMGEVDENHKVVTNTDFALDITLLGFSGKRKELQVKQGEILIYESKCVIFSQRKVQEAKMNYAVGHFYFKPKKNWPWKYMSDGEHMVLTDSDKVKVIMDQITDKEAEPVTEGEGQEKQGLKQDVVGTVEKDSEHGMGKVEL